MTDVLFIGGHIEEGTERQEGSPTTTGQSGSVRELKQFGIPCSGDVSSTLKQQWSRDGHVDEGDETGSVPGEHEMAFEGEGVSVIADDGPVFFADFFGSPHVFVGGVRSGVEVKAEKFRWGLAEAESHQQSLEAR